MWGGGLTRLRGPRPPPPPQPPLRLLMILPPCVGHGQAPPARTPAPPLLRLSSLPPPAVALVLLVQLKFGSGGKGEEGERLVS